MAGKLEGRVALVTSAGQGIGRSSAIALAREGAKVFATDIREDLFKDISKDHPGITGFGLNVLEQPAVDAALKRTGPIDILFNCSGFVHNGTVLDCEEKDWDFSFDLNVKAHYRMIKAYLPGMLAKGKGNVINMASVASSIKGAPNRFVYGASKAAVIGLTKALALELAPRVRVNAVAPGIIESRMIADMLPVRGEEWKRQIPLARYGRPEDVAEAILFLAGDRASYVNGAVLNVNGGMWMD